ncbi:MAG TPA: CRISPR-associated endonuclease Cas2 [Candidatus Cryosericum sp.]|nr:CRISPR-associated endonuclease Cas2 [Candidatus Cryosericum sp.]HPS70301.1 CRISPR-associated endonuclease Cas2 [Candidatus Cryosericum sp.]
MYIIMVYDVNEKRVNRVLKTGRRYLNWVQNSVLEGELTDAQYARLKADVRKRIDQDEDCVLFYVMRTDRYTTRELLGQQKGDPLSTVL